MRRTKEDSLAILCNAVLGVATGDAMGVPYEFNSREDVEQTLLTDMTGYGTHNQPKGTWSDDTSLTLALIDGLIHSGKKIDYGRIADNFADWLWNAKFTARGEVFDVGGTCLKAIRRHLEKPELPAWACGVKSEEACGNGALMRILPLTFWLFYKYGSEFITIPEARDEILKVTAITHANKTCALANLIYVTFAGRLFALDTKKGAWEYTVRQIRSLLDECIEYRSAEGRFSRLLADGFTELPFSSLSGSGYVISTLESAVWCFMNTQEYKICVLESILLGQDTDTTAAVAGGLAGLYYSSGSNGIPKEWLSDLAQKDEITVLCHRFFEVLQDRFPEQ